MIWRLFSTIVFWFINCDVRWEYEWKTSVFWFIVTFLLGMRVEEIRALWRSGIRKVGFCYKPLPFSDKPDGACQDASLHTTRSHKSRRLCGPQR
jgi:hypothetical protein